MTNEWTWEGASMDPASRVWPKPEDCVKLNKSEVYASNLIDAKIKQVLNPSGWANLGGPSRDPHAEPDYDCVATWRDIDSVDDTSFYLAVCDVFKKTFAEPGNPANTIRSRTSIEIRRVSWNDVTGIKTNGHLIARWQKKDSSIRRMEPKDLNP